MQSVKEEYVVYDGYALFADMGGLARHSTKNTYSKIFPILKKIFFAGWCFAWHVLHRSLWLCCRGGWDHLGADRKRRGEEEGEETKRREIVPSLEILLFSKCIVGVRSVQYYFNIRIRGKSFLNTYMCIILTLFRFSSNNRGKRQYRAWREKSSWQTLSTPDRKISSCAGKMVFLGSTLHSREP